MKSLTKLSLAAGIACTTALQAAPLLSLGDSIDVFFDGGATVRHESNVLRANTNEQSDTLFIFSPGFEVIAGRPGETDFGVRVLYRHNFLTYVDMDDLDADHPDFTLELSADSAFLSYRGSVRLYETQSTASLSIVDPTPGMVERAIKEFANYVEMELTPKSSIGTGFDYNQINYDRSSPFGYTDYSNWAIPVDLYYEVTPKMDASIGYRYRSVNVGELSPTGASQDAEDHFFNVGLRNELLPKLTGFAKVGFVRRELDVGGSDDSFFASANLNYEVTPLLDVRLSGYRDFGVSQTGGSSTIRTGINVQGIYELSPVLSAAGTVGYAETDYRSGARNDDFYNLGVSLTYSPNQYFRVTGGYTYAKNSSTSSFYEFENNVLELSALFRY